MDRSIETERIQRDIDWYDELLAYRDIGTPEELLQLKDVADNWIAVSERLPEEPDKGLNPDDIQEYPEYIVTIDNAERATVLFYLGEGTWYDEITEDYYKVTAWQSLPAAYKSGKEQQDEEY